MRVTRTAGDGRKEGAKHIKTYQMDISGYLWIKTYNYIVNAVMGGDERRGARLNQCDTCGAGSWIGHARPLPHAIRYA